MSPRGEIVGTDLNLEDFRPYLDLLARFKVPQWLQRWIDPNDVVQQAFLQAGPHQVEWEGWKRVQVAAYLRKTLENVVRDQADKHLPERTYPDQQKLIDQSTKMDMLLPADQSSPSEIAMREEMLVDLAQALRQLPERQRQAVEMRYLEVPKPSAAQIGEKLECTEKAARELLNRGLQKLRQVLGQSV